MTELETARNEIHDAKPDGWFVGPPTYVEHRKAWEQYAFDTRERPKAGHRSQAWTAVAASEFEVVREFARCLRLIAAGEIPTFGATRGSGLRRVRSPRVMEPSGA